MKAPDSIAPAVPDLHGLTLLEATDAFEAACILDALKRAGNVTRAALSLGIHRNTLHNKLNHNPWLVNAKNPFVQNWRRGASRERD